jgi:hypothetical protein
MNRADPTLFVQASLASDSYTAGDTVTIAIKNIGTAPLVYPLAFCKTELQRKDEARWVSVSAEPVVCRLALAVLSPNQSIAHTFVLSSTLPPGLYRLVMPMPSPSGARASTGPLVTAPFVVLSSAVRKQ